MSTQIHQSRTHWCQRACPYPTCQPPASRYKDDVDGELARAAWQDLPVRFLQSGQLTETCTRYQAVVRVGSQSTAREVKIAGYVSKNCCHLRDDPRMDIGELQPRSSIVPRSRELHALDRTWVICGVVDNGKVIEEV
jgi:hypothetical protein